jgi:hypothetical protein
MSGPTHTDIATVEALLRSYGGNRAPRRAHPDRARRRMFNARAVVAACAAVFVFTPASAVTTLLLLTTDSVGLDLSPIENGSRALLKSDKLDTSADAASSPKTLNDAEDFVRVVTTTVERPAAVNTASAEAADLTIPMIRGRLEDGLNLAAADIAPSQVLNQPVRLRRHSTRIKQPPLKVVAEIAPPEAKPPSLLERLFGSRSL